MPAAPNGHDTAPTAHLVTMADVSTDSVAWLWYPRIPCGRITLLDGDPGIGKSFLTVTFAATVSRGAQWPDGAACAPGDVLLLTCEDGLGDTVRPRLDAAGADVSRVHVLTGYSVGDDLRAVTLQDVEVLGQALETIRPALVIIDPITAYLGRGIDMNKAEQTRPLLAQLGRLAESYETAVILVRHLTKGQRDSAMYRGLGSIDFQAACRSALLAGVVPDRPESRALAHVKSSLAPKAPTLEFAIQDGAVLWSTTPSDLTAEQIVTPPQARAQHRTRVGDAAEFLRTALAGGPRPFADLLEEAEALDLLKHHLIRAHSKLGIVSESAGFPRRTTWRLPGIQASGDASSDTLRG